MDTGRHKFVREASAWDGSLALVSISHVRVALFKNFYDGHWPLP